MLLEDSCYIYAMTWCEESEKKEKEILSLFLPNYTSLSFLDVTRKLIFSKFEKCKRQKKKKDLMNMWDAVWVTL